MRRQLRYAAQGISIGLATLLIIFCSIEIISRFSAGQHIGRKLVGALVLFAMILVLLIYRFVVMTPKRRRRSTTYGAVTELSKGKDDKTKSA